jgi:LysM repeat protein
VASAGGPTAPDPVTNRNTADTSGQRDPLEARTEGLTAASQGCYNRAAPTWPEVRMRPYRIEDEALDEDEEYPRVIPIGAGGRSGPTAFPTGLRHQPWTPRATALPAAPPREAQSPLTLHRSGFTRTHQLMIASFVIVCVGMILGMTLVRVWDEASRAVAALPPEGSIATARAPGTLPAPPAHAESGDVTAPQVAGAVTTEIRVLQPNYTVAPGDTLGIIARRHGTNVEALASINNLENRNSLGVGQKLIIP